MSKKILISDEMKEKAENQIKEMQKQVDYDTKDWTIEYIINKFDADDFFIPPYQRQFVWDDKRRSSFIESIFLGLPTPFMFFSDCDDGRLEIIDGAQRIQTLVHFRNHNFTLKSIEKLNLIEGFSFKDLPMSQQRKFLNKSLRVIVLEDSTPDEVRQDLFYRINTGGLNANPSEVRRGAYNGELTKFIEQCTKNDTFKKLAPMNEKQENRYERFELVLRFFAYLNSYENVKQEVSPFLDDYLKNNLEKFDKLNFKNEFEGMLNFVEKTFPNGFAKGNNYSTTPRVRFEALAVGAALALREKPDLEVKNIDWIESDKFKKLTTSDASNSSGKLKKRIEYVRNKLLGLNDE